MDSKTSVSLSVEQIINSIQSTPEFILLKNITENNICHDNETVLHHSLRVVKRFEELLKHCDFGKDVSFLAQSYFSAKIGSFTRKDLFIFSAYLHDVGKTDTIRKDEKDITSCLGHEIKSAEIARGILVNLGLKTKEVEYIEDIIKLHGGYPLRFLDCLENLGETKLRETLRNSYYLPEIFLYMIADNEAAPIFASYKLSILKKILVNKEIYSVKKSSQVAAGRLGELVKIAALAIKKYSKPWPLEVRMLHLSEEVGELHDIYLQYLGLKDRKQELEHLIGGLNDILLEMIAIYDYLGIDICEALEKEAKRKGE